MRRRRLLYSNATREPIRLPQAQHARRGALPRSLARGRLSWLCRASQFTLLAQFVRLHADGGGRSAEHRSDFLPSAPANTAAQGLGGVQASVNDGVLRGRPVRCGLSAD